MEAPAIRARPRAEDERCPSCHDLVAPGEVAAAMVVCPACGTSHHAECAAELGRCTVLGCEHPLVAPEGMVDDAGSSLRREVRRRLGDRARAFVARNTRSVAADDPGARSRVKAAVHAVQRARLPGHERELVPALDQLIELEVGLGGGVDRHDIAGWIPLELEGARGERARIARQAAAPAIAVPVPRIAPAILLAFARALMAFILVSIVGLGLLWALR